MTSPAEVTSLDRMVRSLNRLAKWRAVFTGRILGTRSTADPQAQGFRDLFEKLLIQRAELSALSRLCIERGVFTEEQFQNAVAVESDFLDEALEAVFPGFKATDAGVTMDQRAAATMKGWPA